MIGGSVILVNVSVPDETIRIRVQVEQQYMRASHLQHGRLPWPGLQAEVRDDTSTTESGGCVIDAAPALFRQVTF
jgi:hypothetical protein